MGFWEFLIQKEGDRSWLPLESPDVEILEGRYRVVARSNRVNTAVEVQITHIATDEDPPKRRTQKRSGQTNRDGLIVVIPFTRLQPGTWELSCAGDLMADFTGDGWHYTVKLQVLSHATEANGDWESDYQDESQSLASSSPAPTPSSPLPPHSSSPASPPFDLNRLTPVPPAAIAPTQASEADTSQADTSQADTSEEISNFKEADNDPSRATLSEAVVTSPIFELATRLSQEVVDSVFQELDETSAPTPESRSSEVVSPDSTQVNRTTSPEASSDESPEASASPSAGDYPPLQLTLTQSTYAARRGETLTLKGQIEPLLSLESLPPLMLGLRVRLYDPQTAQTLFQDERSLPVVALPSAFECPVTIPDGYQTRLLLGDLALVAGAAELATQSFTVTADLTELLEALANAHTESDLVQPPLEFTTPATAADLDLTFLEFLQTPKPMLQFQASDKQAIPPQLSSVKSGSVPQRAAIADPMATRRSATGISPQVDLPHAAQASASNNIPSSNEVQSPQLPLAPPSQSHEAHADESNVATPSPTLSDLVVDDATLSPHDWQMTSVPQTSTSQAKPAPSPADTAFRSLNLQNRFLSRLNALAGDAELSSWLRQDPIEALPVNEAPLGLDTDLAAQEVVVDDLPSYSMRQATPTPIEPPPALVLPEDEPVPAPILHVPPGELISGNTLFITVQLPEVRSRIYVKLWVLDRQTRSLLDGPRWFMAFVPDGCGNLETRTQITIPYGCLEASFEAIAIEMMTKRESHKVVCDRPIIPPDLPSLASEELDF